MLENSSQIVDALRDRLAVETDSAVAAALGVKHSAVGHWRMGRSAMSPELAIKAAGLLGVEPGPLVLVCLAESERQAPIAALFRQLARKLNGGTRRHRRAAAAIAAVAVGAGLVAAPAPSQAATGPAARAGVCILCPIGEWARGRGWRRRRRRSPNVTPATIPGFPLRLRAVPSQ